MPLHLWNVQWSLKDWKGKMVHTYVHTEQERQREDKDNLKANVAKCKNWWFKVKCWNSFKGLVGHEAKGFQQEVLGSNIYL